MVFSRKHVVLLILFAVSFFVFSQSLNIHGIEYRDDEIFYYKSTAEMVEDKNYLSPTYFGNNRFQKPILFYWFILLSYKIFGVNWFAARLVSVLFASLSIVVNWLFIKKLFNEKVAYLSSFILMTSPMFFRHARNVVPDMTLFFFILLAYYFLILFIENPKSTKYSVLFFISCALGFLIKGFAALVVPMVPFIIYTFVIGERKLIKQIKFGRGFGIFFLIVLPWFIFMLYKHGMSYITYMVVDETQNRLVRDMEGSVVLFKIKEFFMHSLFYLQVIVSSLAPWGIFFILACLFGFYKCKNRPFEKSLRLMWLWIGFVFLLFSAMSYKISHYMLVLITPMSAVVSYYFLYDEFEGVKKERKYNYIIQQVLLVIIVIMLIACFSILSVYLLKWSKWWLFVFLGIGGLCLKWIIFNQSRFIPPVILAGLLCVLFSQSALISEAGISSHMGLRKFAQKVNAEIEADDVIGVGSHDIHEKEWQVYFDREVIKAATDNEKVTNYFIRQLLAKSDRVYCLLTEEDFNKHILNKYSKSVEIIMQDYMIRKRMSLDLGFFKAIIMVDQNRVFNYLMEKVILVRRVNNV